MKNERVPDTEPSPPRTRSTPPATSGIHVTGAHARGRTEDSNAEERTAWTDSRLSEPPPPPRIYSTLPPAVKQRWEVLPPTSGPAERELAVPGAARTPSRVDGHELEVYEDDTVPTPFRAPTVSD